jgi:hypothetical protein
MKDGLYSRPLVPNSMLIDQDLAVFNLLPALSWSYGQDVLLGPRHLCCLVHDRVSFSVALSVYTDQGLLGSQHGARLHQHARYSCLNRCPEQSQRLSSLSCELARSIVEE